MRATMAGDVEENCLEEPDWNLPKGAGEEDDEAVEAEDRNDAPDVAEVVVAKGLVPPGKNGGAMV